jgi:hypothetical protein
MAVPIFIPALRLVPPVIVVIEGAVIPPILKFAALNVAVVKFDEPIMRLLVPDVKLLAIIKTDLLPPVVLLLPICIL